MPSVYFVHSYYAAPSDETIIATETDYPTPFASAVWQDNVFATQFHPEKSQARGWKCCGGSRNGGEMPIITCFGRLRYCRDLRSWPGRFAAAPRRPAADSPATPWYRDHVHRRRLVSLRRGASRLQRHKAGADLRAAGPCAIVRRGKRLALGPGSVPRSSCPSPHPDPSDKGPR